MWEQIRSRSACRFAAAMLPLDARYRMISEARWIFATLFPFVDVG